MKTFKGVHIGKLDPIRKGKFDFIYYWHNGRLIYYGSIPGTGLTKTCDNIATVEQYLTLRRNENFIE